MPSDDNRQQKRDQIFLYLKTLCKIDSMILPGESDMLLMCVICYIYNEYKISAKWWL